MSIDKIWVLVEVGADGISVTSLELLSQARKLSREVVGFAPQASNGVVNVSGHYGASSLVSLLLDKGLMFGVSASEVMARRIRGGDIPNAIFFGSTPDGRDCAARLSVKLDRPVITNVVNLELEEEVLIAEHAIFGGDAILKSCFTSDGPAIFVIRPKSFVAENRVSEEVLMIEEVIADDLGVTSLARVIKSQVEKHSGPKLEEASVVVSGGRGLGQAESYQMIETLASLLHGAPGASRAIVDSGWVPYSNQVGQTGKTVKPDLYIACGISGASQHMVGMKGAQKIIAINKDADAPIFSIADLGIIGDVHKVIPKLISVLQESVSTN